MHCFCDPCRISFFLSIFNQAETFLLLLLSSRSRSQRELIWSKHDSFYYIFWTVDSLATKLGLMIHHQKPECPVKKIGFLHSVSQWRVKMLMFVQLISSKPPNILLPNLILWCIIMSWNAHRKIGLLFSGSRSQQGLIWPKYDSFYYIFWTAHSFATKLVLIIHYHKPEWGMEKLYFCSKSRSHQNFKMSMSVCPDDTFWIAEPFASKLGILIHHYEPDCLPKKNWLAVFKVKVTVKDHIIRLPNMSRELLILLHLNLVC